METLKLIRQETTEIKTCGDVIIRLADFIKSCIDDHSFIWVWISDDEFLHRHITVDTSPDIAEYIDLYYESPRWYYNFIDYMDEHPEYENKEPYITLKARLCFLRDKDLIPNVI